MTDNLPKYILAFLAVIYLLGCAGELIATKDGASLVFESVKTFVPHMTMFVLGFYFSKR